MICSSHVIPDERSEDPESILRACTVDPASSAG
jgi:hypothetical protein